jgi:hypothetical protein
MPITPSPMKLTCRQCGRSMVFAPRCDAFVTPSCEQCGECQWDHTELSILDRLNPTVLLQSLFKMTQPVCAASYTDAKY